MKAFILALQLLVVLCLGSAGSPSAVTLSTAGTAPAATSEAVGVGGAAAVALPPSAIEIGASPLAAQVPPDEQVLQRLLDTYAAAVAEAPASCNVSVPLLAALGQVLSGSLVGRDVADSGQVTPAVLGPVLDGHGFPRVADTDDGRLDGDRRWDRAVGPMQLLPADWSEHRSDGDGDGRSDPQDVDDAVPTMVSLLCADGRDLDVATDLRAALGELGEGRAFRLLVLRWQDAFADAMAAAAASAPVMVATVEAVAGPALHADPDTIAAAQAERRGSPDDVVTAAREKSLTDTQRAGPGVEPGAASSATAGKADASQSGTPSASPSGQAAPQPSLSAGAPSTGTAQGSTSAGTSSGSAQPSGTPSGTPSEKPSDKPSGSPSASPGDACPSSDPTADASASASAGTAGDASTSPTGSPLPSGGATAAEDGTATPDACPAPDPDEKPSDPAGPTP